MTIVAAIDRTDEADEVLAQATDLADAYDETVHVVHALRTSNFLDIERRSIKADEGSVPIAEVRETAEEIAEERAEAVLSSFKAVGRVGDPATIISEYAEEVDARYIVLGGRKRGPIGKIMFGSTAQDILLDATAPVVVVRVP